MSRSCIGQARGARPSALAVGSVAGNKGEKIDEVCSQVLVKVTVAVSVAANITRASSIRGGLVKGTARETTPIGKRVRGAVLLVIQHRVPGHSSAMTRTATYWVPVHAAVNAPQWRIGGHGTAAASAMVEGCFTSHTAHPHLVCGQSRDFEPGLGGSVDDGFSPRRRTAVTRRVGRTPAGRGGRRGCVGGESVTPRRLNASLKKKRKGGRARCLCCVLKKAPMC